MYKKQTKIKMTLSKVKIRNLVNNKLCYTYTILHMAKLLYNQCLKMPNKLLIIKILIRIMNIISVIKNNHKLLISRCKDKTISNSRLLLMEMSKVLIKILITMDYFHFKIVFIWLIQPGIKDNIRFSYMGRTKCS